MGRYVPQTSGGGGGGGSINALPSQTAGVAVSNSSRGTVTPTAKAGVAVSLAPATLLMPETAGVGLVQSVAGTVKQAQTAGISQVTSLSLPGIPQASGVKVTQTFNLVQTNGATGASSTGSWTNPTSANGLHDGGSATNANSVTAAASGSLTLTYGAQVNKTSLTITNVTINGFWSYAAGSVGPCTAIIEHSVDGISWTNEYNGTGSKAYALYATDVTALIAGSWTNVANFRVRATLTGASSATASTLSVDAFELVVTANTTIG